VSSKLSTEFTPSTGRTLSHLAPADAKTTILEVEVRLQASGDIYALIVAVIFTVAL
jgi:hypothetical protein